MNILGFYKKTNLLLVEKDGVYFVVDRQDKTILYQGDEEECTKVFVMMLTEFIDKCEFIKEA